MKVLLVNPSITFSDVQHYSKAIEKQRGTYPPLGLGYVASSLEHAGHDVKIFDLDAEENHVSRLLSLVKEYNPEVVGMYVMTWTFNQANELAKKMKSLLPHAFFIMGGPNVCSFPEQSLKYSVFDYAVQGEGEEASSELLNALSSGDAKKAREIRGVIYRSGGNVVVNPQRELISNLDSIPFPAWHLLPISKYYDVFTRKTHFATLISSRGCPYQCTYCDRVNRMGSKWRSRTPKNIVDEIEFLNGRYGIQEFMFFDDNFVIDKKRVYDLCSEILGRGLDVLWEVRARVDLIDAPLLKEMQKAGCYRIRYGMESGDDEILRTLKKGITVEQIKSASKLTKDAGIEVFAYFMMGSPGETKLTLQKTLDLALKIDPDFVAFSRTILIVGSELFDWGVRNNQIKEDFWERFLLGEEKDSAPGISTEELPEAYVKGFISRADRKFYFRPSYILRRLKSLSSPAQLMRQGRLAAGLLHSKITAHES